MMKWLVDDWMDQRELLKASAWREKAQMCVSGKRFHQYLAQYRDSKTVEWINGSEVNYALNKKK